VIYLPLEVPLSRNMSRKIQQAISPKQRKSTGFQKMKHLKIPSLIEHPSSQIQLRLCPSTKHDISVLPSHRPLPLRSDNTTPSTRHKCHPNIIYPRLTNNHVSTVCILSYQPARQATGATRSLRLFCFLSNRTWE